MQQKSIIHPNFLIAVMELEEAFLDGWRIDTVKYPFMDFVCYHIYLVKEDSEAVKDVFVEAPAKEAEVVVKKAGRPAKGAK
jgi:hypothetical protein